jgi:hypothetical protein
MTVIEENQKKGAPVLLMSSSSKFPPPQAVQLDENASVVSPPARNACNC